MKIRLSLTELFENLKTIHYDDLLLPPHVNHSVICESLLFPQSLESLSILQGLWSKLPYPNVLNWVINICSE